MGPSHQNFIRRSLFTIGAALLAGLAIRLALAAPPLGYTDLKRISQEHQIQSAR